jgi:hypothetical protein
MLSTNTIDMEPSSPSRMPHARLILDLFRHGHNIVKPAVCKVHNRRGSDVVQHEGLQVAGFTWMKPGTIMNPMSGSRSCMKIDLIGIDVRQTSSTSCFMNNRLGLKSFMWSFTSIVNLGVLFKLKNIFVVICLIFI